MEFTALNWNGPFPFENLSLGSVPREPGVYVFSESAGELCPNPPLPSRSSPQYQRAIERLRARACVLYVGRSKDLGGRLRGYRFTPYLEIRRRPKGSPPRHTADRHKGRALLHAHQYFEGQLYVRWAVTEDSHRVEAALIRELRPVLNTMGLPRER
jgi:hypothetical protein